MNFPNKPQPSLTDEEVISYLQGLMKKGFTVYKDETHSKLFYIDFINSYIEILSYPGNDNRAQVTLKNGARTYRIGVAENYLSMVAMIEQTGRQMGVNLSSQSQSTRLVKNQPLSNIGKIVSVIDSIIITGVFDPFFEDNSLYNLTVMKNLGVKFSPALKVLTNKKEPSERGWGLFNKELNLQQSEIKKTLISEHRRFMIGGGKSFIIGPSLNQLDHNEAIFSDSDSEDKPFFDNEWGKGTSLKLR